MIEEVECQITWCKISCMRLKKDFTYIEEFKGIIVKQVWYKNPHREWIY